jgi:DNA-binding NtrC family response regulator
MAEIIPFQQSRQGCRVLITAPNGRTRDKLIADATIAGYEVQVCADLASAADHLAQIDSDVCLVDLDETVGDLNGFCRSASRWRQSVTLLGLASLDLLGSPDVDAAGQFELIPKPYPSNRLAGRLAKASQRLKLSQEIERLKQSSQRRLFDEFVGCSEKAELLRDKILDAAEKDAPLVVTGERGSGTTLLARAVHLFSSRADSPLIAVDCSLQSSTALEQDLFGTPVNGLAVGSSRIKQAAGGTLILENLETVPLPLQKTLAKFIRQVSILECPQQESVRVIAVTAAEPECLVDAGQLDSGLWQLLSEQIIVVPSLRERRDDVVPLAEHFLQRLSVQEGQPCRGLSYDARQLLVECEWPGNVSQLCNVIQKAAAIDNTGTLTADSLRPWLDGESLSASDGAPGMTLREMERKLIETTFNRFCGNREQTAQTLSIGLRTLSGKLREYGYPPRGGPGSNIQPAQRKVA